MEEKLDARHLQLIINAPREPLMIRADGRRLWRVLENLYNNVCKYAMEGSRVYVDLTRVPGMQKPVLPIRLFSPSKISPPTRSTSVPTS